MSHDPTKKYDLFCTEEAAKYYSSYTPPLAPRVINHVLRRTSEHGFLVDAGCGSGSSSRPFSDHFKSVVGVDYSDAQIELARELTCQENISFVNSSLDVLPFEDSSVDCILGVMLIQFLDVPLFYKEVDRVLKKGGCLVLHGKCCPVIKDNLLNNRLLYVKNKLFKGLWHDRTMINATQYGTIPMLYPDSCEREDFTVSKSWTIPDLVNFILSWSSALKYCQREGISYQELYDKLVGMLSDDENIESNYDEDGVVNGVTEKDVTISANQHAAMDTEKDILMKIFDVQYDGFILSWKKE